MTHATHFIYSYMERKGNVFYLMTHSTHFIYGIRHVVKDHSDSEKGNPLPPHSLLFPINSMGSFICTIHQTAVIWRRTCGKEPFREGERKPVATTWAPLSLLLYESSHRQHNTYHSLCYTSHWLEREIAQ